MAGTTFLYRPVNQVELNLIAASDWRAFPPRLPEQPIFYPVTNEDYAAHISRDWNVPYYSVGHGCASRSTRLTWRNLPCKTWATPSTTSYGCPPSSWPSSTAISKAKLK
jgi:hypothetical protein